MTLREYLQRKYGKSTLKSNLYNIRRFRDYMSCVAQTEEGGSMSERSQTANYKDILNYIEYLRKNYDLHPKTLRHCLYAVKIYFNYLLEIGKRDDHPCSELYLKDKVSKEIQVDRLYSEETLENYFATYQIRKKKHLERRNKIIISLLIYQALTVKEIAELEIQNIDLEKGEIYIKGNQERTSKSPQSRTLPLQAKQILLFYQYLEKDRPKLLAIKQQPSSNHQFILGQYGKKINPHGISKMINETRRENEKIQPIKIRQSVIANLLKRESNVRLVQVFSGHRRSSTTQGYEQTELEQLGQSISLYHPRR